MTRMSYIFVSLLVAVLLFPNVGYGTQYEYDASIDLSAALINGTSELEVFLSPGPSFNLQRGDSISGNITFQGNDGLEFAGPVSGAEINFDFFGISGVKNPPLIQSEVVTVDLAAPSFWAPGQLTSANPYSATISGAAVISPTLLMSSDGTFVVTGFQYDTTIVQGGDAIFPFHFDAVDPSGVFVTQVVPEPSALILLCLTGLVVLFCGRKLCSVY